MFATTAASQLFLIFSGFNRKVGARDVAKKHRMAPAARLQPRF
jgi:hypothetical protein